jgi:hypothetical protein
MILLDTILHEAIGPAMALLPARMESREARVELLAIGLQESRFQYRAQKTSDPYTRGPARGFWQMERAGGVRGVMTHPKSADLARWVCTERGVSFDDVLVHARLEFDDVLAAAFARLLLWTDPKPLPALSAPASEGWAYYLRNWRPGKPHPETWDAYHEQAVAQILTPEERPQP